MRVVCVAVWLFLHCVQDALQVLTSLQKVIGAVRMQQQRDGTKPKSLLEQMAKGFCPSTHRMGQRALEAERTAQRTSEAESARQHALEAERANQRAVEAERASQQAARLLQQKEAAWDAEVASAQKREAAWKAELAAAQSSNVQLRAKVLL